MIEPLTREQAVADAKAAKKARTSKPFYPTSRKSVLLGFVTSRRSTRCTNTRCKRGPARPACWLSRLNRYPRTFPTLSTPYRPDYARQGTLGLPADAG